MPAPGSHISSRSVSSLRPGGTADMRADFVRAFRLFALGPWLAPRSRPFGRARSVPRGLELRDQELVDPGVLGVLVAGVGEVGLDAGLDELLPEGQPHD